MIRVDATTKKITWSYASENAVFSVNVDYKESSASNWINLQTSSQSTVKEWTIDTQLKQNTEYAVRVTTVVVGGSERLEESEQSSFRMPIKTNIFFQRLLPLI